jgi:DNA-binding winged helix-turn-helix (wHTH) protein
MPPPTRIADRPPSPADHQSIIRGLTRHNPLVSAPADRQNRRMAAERRVVFGPFEADLITGELRQHGERVRLQHQPFQVLAALLERPGTLVTPEELRRRLWPDGTHVAFERGLASALRKVREALDDHARAPRYIETLHRRGYRFIAPVSAAPVSLADPQGSAPSPAVSRRPTRLRWAAALVAALLIGGQSRSPAGADDRLSAAQSLSSYACLLKSRGEFERALHVIRQAQTLAPRSAKITAEVGFYLHAAGYYDAEFPMLERAAALDPASVDVWLHMGLAHARRENFTRAAESLERASGLPGADENVTRWLTWVRARHAPPRGPA